MSSNEWLWELTYMAKIYFEVPYLFRLEIFFSIH